MENGKWKMENEAMIIHSQLSIINYQLEKHEHFYLYRTGAWCSRPSGHPPGVGGHAPRALAGGDVSPHRGGRREPETAAAHLDTSLRCLPRQPPRGGGRPEAPAAADAGLRRKGTFSRDTGAVASLAERGQMAGAAGGGVGEARHARAHRPARRHDAAGDATTLLGRRGLSGGRCAEGREPLHLHGARGPYTVCGRGEAF